MFCLCVCVCVGACVRVCVFLNFFFFVFPTCCPLLQAIIDDEVTKGFSSESEYGGRGHVSIWFSL